MPSVFLLVQAKSLPDLRHPSPLGAIIAHLRAHGVTVRIARARPHHACVLDDGGDVAEAIRTADTIVLDSYAPPHHAQEALAALDPTGHAPPILILGEVISLGARRAMSRRARHLFPAPTRTIDYTMTDEAHLLECVAEHIPLPPLDVSFRDLPGRFPVPLALPGPESPHGVGVMTSPSSDRWTIALEDALTRALARHDAEATTRALRAILRSQLMSRDIAHRAYERLLLHADEPMLGAMEPALLTAVAEATASSLVAPLPGLLELLHLRRGALLAQAPEWLQRAVTQWEASRTQRMAPRYATAARRRTGLHSAIGTGAAHLLLDQPELARLRVGAAPIEDPLLDMSRTAQGLGYIGTWMAGARAHGLPQFLHAVITQCPASIWQSAAVICALEAAITTLPPSSASDWDAWADVLPHCRAARLEHLVRQQLTTWPALSEPVARWIMRDPAHDPWRVLALLPEGPLYRSLERAVLGLPPLQEAKHALLTEITRTPLRH